MKIKAAVCRGSQDGFTIDEIELSDPRDDEILIRIVGVGLCHTDLTIKGSGIGGTSSAVLGHEGSGIVEEVGAKVTKVQPGDRVVVTFRSCGECRNCSRGDPAYCHESVLLNVSGGRTDGSKCLSSHGVDIASNFFGQSSFASHAIAYESNVVKVDAAAPLDMLGPLGCGIQTGFGAIVRSLDCQKGDGVAILGGGSVGLSAVMGAALRDCSPIIVVEPVEARRALALELGATHAIDPAAIAGDLSDAIKDIAPHGVEFVLDTTGIPALQNQGVASLAPKGVIGIVGITPPGAPPPGEMKSMMIAGQSVKGIIEGDSQPDDFIPEMVALFMAGKLPFDKMVTKYPLADINTAVKDQLEGRCIKAILLP